MRNEKVAEAASPSLSNAFVFIDPLGLSTNIDQETFDQYRTAELKHGRVAQLAVIGYIVPEIYRFPGEIAPGIKFADIPNGVAALDAIPALGWAQMFFLIGAVDYYGFLGNFEAGQAPGMDAAELEKRSLNELQHGRLAMLAVLELLRHDSQNLVSPGFDGLDNMITGLPFLYQ
jgi:Chlorophyll A-B binding protein